MENKMETIEDVVKMCEDRIKVLENRHKWLMEEVERLQKPHKIECYSAFSRAVASKQKACTLAQEGNSLAYIICELKLILQKIKTGTES